jgi:tetratricopeptide (TPR) repeat protein
MAAAAQTSSPRPTVASAEKKTNPWTARPQIIVAALLVLAILAVFAQTTKFGFISIDDFDYVRDNEAVNNGLSWASFNWAFHHDVAANWHPVTMLTHMLDCQIYGVVPGAHHFTNVLLHISNTLLLFFLLLRITRKQPNNLWFCSFVAVLFAVHPLHVESVAWISERKDVLSGFFFMLTLWAYVRYAEGRSADPQRSFLSFDGWSISKFCSLGFGVLKWYLLALGLFAFDLMSKPMVVTLPCVLVLLDYWPLQRITKFNFRGFGVSIVEKVPFFALTAIFSVITVHAQKGAKAVVSFQDWPLKSRMATAMVACAQYIGKTFVPTKLGVLYPHTDLTDFQVTGSTILFVVICFVALLLARSKRYLFVGWFVFAGMMFPVSGIMQVGEQAFADRFTYLPHIGLFVVLAWGLAEVTALRSKIPIIVGALALVCLPATYQQVQRWSDSETLFRNCIRVAENNATAHHYLGVLLDEQGKTNEAFLQFSQAVQYNPNNVTARCGLAYEFSARNQFTEAAQHYQAALEVEPDNAKAHYGLADCLLKMGQITPALTQYSEALRYQPDIAGAYFQIGTAMLSAKHNPKDALDYIRAAVRFAPDWTQALNTLAWTLATHADATMRNGEEAVKFGTRAVTVTRGNDAGLLDTLGAAYAEDGKFPNAVYAVQRAIQRAKATADTNSIPEFESHLKSFQAQKPWRE